MLLSPTRMKSIKKIVTGCKKVVYDAENEAYNRRLKSKVSNRYLTLLSINDHLLSANITKDFRPADVENSLPEGLRNKDYYSDVSRILKWHVTKMVVKDSLDFQPETRPGRHKLNSSTALSGDPSYYSASGYRLVFERVARSFVSRAIIYTILRDSKVIHRLFQLMAYKRLIAVRSTKPSRVLKGLKSLGLGTDSSFNESKYISDQNMLLQKNKKEIISMASKTADKFVEEVDWHARFYTEFFIVGGLTYYEDPGFSCPESIND